MATIDETNVQKMAELWITLGGDSQGFSLLQYKIFTKLEDIEYREETNAYCSMCGTYTTKDKMYNDDMCQGCKNEEQHYETVYGD